jgi:endonuclease/exonuclease/phosphatase family metal-dependent hydrolase
MKHFIIAATLLITTAAEASTLKFMQYNIENFFDTSYDKGTDDFTFLPLATKKTLAGHKEFCAKMTGLNQKQCLNLDWNEAKFTKKILNVAKVVKAFDATGKGPDIAVFEEVENINVLNKLMTKGLDKLGYRQAILIEGDDSRGIDVGLITKYPVVSSKHHSVFVNGQKLDTRGILEVVLNVNGQTVVVFVNHWPSQNNPVGDRIASAQLLEKVAADKAGADLILAAGDFNTIKSDNPYPFNTLKSFIDTEAQARTERSDIFAGTHNFKGEWTSLDKIFVHKTSAIQPNYSTYTIFNHSFLLKNGTPIRTNFETGEGFSDHLPVGIQFNL